MNLGIGLFGKFIVLIDRYFQKNETQIKIQRIKIERYTYKRKSEEDLNMKLPYRWQKIMGIY